MLPISKRFLDPVRPVFFVLRDPHKCFSGPQPMDGFVNRHARINKKKYLVSENTKMQRWLSLFFCEKKTNRMKIDNFVFLNWQKEKKITKKERLNNYEKGNKTKTFKNKHCNESATPRLEYQQQQKKNGKI